MKNTLVTQPKTADQLSTDVDAAREELRVVDEKLSETGRLLQAAEGTYESDFEKFALDGGKEPSRQELDRAILSQDSLRRVKAKLQQKADAVIAEWKQVKLAEDIAVYSKRILVQTAEAESLAAEFEKAVSQAFAAENRLRALLYGKEGLKQAMPTRELELDGRRVRFGIANRLKAAAEANQHLLKPTFYVDGHDFLGEVSQWLWDASQVARNPK